MDIYSLTLDYVSCLPISQSWPEFRVIFNRIAAHQPKHWLLPVKSCLAVGGSAEQAIPAVAAIACAQIGIILLDDMLDEDPRGEYHRLGHGVAANLGATFQLAGLEAMFSPEMPLSLKIDTLHSTNQMLLAVAFGQDIDVKCPTNETSYWQIVENKSAAFFGTALLLGAVLGGASKKKANGMKRFGQLYGEMIQIHDDLNDSMAVPAGPDWLQKRAPLPILFAQIVDHPEKKRFMELYENIAQSEALKEAQEILIHCGAVSYCIDQLLHRHLAAQKLLDITQLANQQILYDLSNEIVEPVWNVFDLLGVQPVTPFLSKLERAG
jgi:geranylgeranyl pyrophosphate synthase